MEMKSGELLLGNDDADRRRGVVMTLKDMATGLLCGGGGGKLKRPQKLTTSFCYTCLLTLFVDRRMVLSA